MKFNHRTINEDFWAEKIFYISKTFFLINNKIEASTNAFR